MTGYDEDLSFLSELSKKFEKRFKIKKKTLEQQGCFPESDLMETFSASFCISNETFKIFYDGETYDMKNRVSDRVWKIGGGDKVKQMNNPNTNWILRSALRISAMDALLEIDELADVTCIPPF